MCSQFNGIVVVVIVIFSVHMCVYAQMLGSKHILPIEHSRWSPCIINMYPVQGALG